jgi:uncharacterized membrane protein
MTTIDAHATLARVEQTIECLRTSYVCQSWKLNEEGECSKMKTKGTYLSPLIWMRKPH